MGFRKKFFQRGQSTFEFVFGMICVVLLVIGITRVLLWAGKELTSRRLAHEISLTKDLEDCTHSACIFEQLIPKYSAASGRIVPFNPQFFVAEKLQAAVPSDIYDPVLIRCEDEELCSGR